MGKEQRRTIQPDQRTFLRSLSERIHSPRFVNNVLLTSAVAASGGAGASLIADLPMNQESSPTSPHSTTALATPSHRPLGAILARNEVGLGVTGAFVLGSGALELVSRRRRKQAGTDLQEETLQQAVVQEVTPPSSVAPVVAEAAPVEPLHEDQLSTIAQRLKNKENALTLGEEWETRAEYKPWEMRQNQHATVNSAEIQWLIDDLVSSPVLRSEYKSFLRKQVKAAEYLREPGQEGLFSIALNKRKRPQLLRNNGEDEWEYLYTVNYGLCEEGTDARIREAITTDFTDTTDSTDFFTDLEINEANTPLERRNLAASVLRSSDVTRADDYKRAVTLFDAVSPQFKGDTWFDYEYGVSLVRAGGRENVKQGVTLLEEAVNLQESQQGEASELLRIGLAEAYGRDGQYDESRVQYEAVAQRDPDNEHVAFLKGEDDTLQARSWDLYREARRDITDGDDLQALVSLEKALILGAKETVGWAAHDKGKLLLAMGHADEAVKALKTATAHEPENALIHYSLGQASQELGDIAGSEEAFRKVLELDPENSEALAHFQKLHNPIFSVQYTHWEESSENSIRTKLRKFGWGRSRSK